MDYSVRKNMKQKYVILLCVLWSCNQEKVDVEKFYGSYITNMHLEVKGHVCETASGCDNGGGGYCSVNINNKNEIWWCNKDYCFDENRYRK